MKCSLKDGFINILLIILIAPSQGIEFPLFLHKSSVLDKPMNLQQFRASINRLQDLDSFPGISENQLHRIVKKQMTGSDFKDARRNKRAVVSSPEIAGRFARGGAGDGADINSKDDEKAEEAATKRAFLKTRSAEATVTESFLKRLKEFAREKESIFTRGYKKTPSKTNKGKGTEEDQIHPEREKVATLIKDTPLVKETSNLACEPKNTNDIKGNYYLTKQYKRFPDTRDYRCYYECEVHPNGCLKLRHRRCPKGQFFSYKYLKCLKSEKKIRFLRRKKRTGSTPKMPDVSPDDPEPSNEWLDANQGVAQRIPSEFKPKKKPDLRIYHIRAKRTTDKRLQKEVAVANREWDKSSVTGVNGKEQIPENKIHDARKKAEAKRHHRPRSFVIHINKKEGKGDQITDSNENENDSDEDDEETDEEDEDEEADEEDEESETEDPREITQEKPHKETLKDLLRSAKEAVTNRMRFEDPTQIAPRAIKEEKNNPSLKSKKSDESKKVLIDANIKVDSTLGSVLRNFLKSRKKDLEAKAAGDDTAAFVSDREIQGQQDPEMIRMYENLIKTNPRVKRYFQTNYYARSN